MSNIFKRLACFGEEDFFTASLALFIERDKNFRFAFLNWLQSLVNEDLTGYAWEVRIQDSRKSQYGEAILDMVLAHSQIELWFEHKVGAQLNRYASESGNEVDQLEKYLDAAARVMTDPNTANAEVTWPEDGPVEGKPKIILFYISRSGSSLIREQYGEKTYGANQFGLAFPENNRQLRWRDFYPVAVTALSDTLSGSNGVFESTLAKQFLQYWQGIKGMWKHHTYDKNWQDLIPSDEELGTTGTAGFDGYLDEIENLVIEHFGWGKPTNYKGKSREISIPDHEIEFITVSPVYSVENDVPNYYPDLGVHVLKLRCRMSGAFSMSSECPERVCHSAWNAVVKQFRSSNKYGLEIYVAINNWDSSYSDERKSKEVTHAFLAGLYMLESLTQTQVAGLRDL